ncbi:hypothetical protein ABZ464_19710 [Streptomyces sp. NPDC005820]|uniref:hypothetical protein n=1 Tax=Streptomyces sp. NPDC005820 TaxID=3157069 RepID=UPI0033E2A437
MNQTVVVAELLAAVGGGVGAGGDGGADTVGVGRGAAVAVCAGWDDRAGVAEDTGVEGDVVSGTAEDGGRPAVAWSPGRVGCAGCGVLDGDGECWVPVGTGRDVLEVSGEAVREGEGARVGRDRSEETEGDGRDVPSSEAVSAQIPRPPAARTTAAPTIHDDLLGGRR